MPGYNGDNHAAIEAAAQAASLRRFTPAEIIALAQSKPLFSRDELCASMNMSRPTLTQMARDGRLAEMGIRPLKAGKNWRFPSADILRVLGLGIPAPRARRTSSRKPRTTEAA